MVAITSGPVTDTSALWYSWAGESVVVGSNVPANQRQSLASDVRHRDLEDLPVFLRKSAFLFVTGKAREKSAVGSFGYARSSE